MSQDVRTVFLACLADLAPEGDLDALEPDESLREQLDIDSMDILHLAQALHAKLGVEIPELDYPRLDELDGAVAYLEAKLG